MSKPKYDERLDNLLVTVTDKWAGDGIASQCGLVFTDRDGRELTWMTDHLTWERLNLRRGDFVVLESGFRYGSDVKRVKIGETK